MISAMVTPEERRHIEDRLVILDIVVAVAQRQREFVDVMTDAADDEHAVAALRRLFECSTAQATVLLAMQLRRLATAERARAAAERNDLVAELDDNPRAPEPEQPTSKPRPSPQARRSPQNPDWYADAITALLTVSADAQGVVSLVSGARDVPDASDLLQHRYGWDYPQATAALDMQFRTLTGAGRARLEAALRQ
jgi:DNA gyrase/topoisomerase IV subunit A